MKSAKIITLLLCLLGFTACSKREGVLNGSVFIVTKSQESVKMGLVSIMLFEENVFKDSVTPVQAVYSNMVAEFKSKHPSVENQVSEREWMIAHDSTTYSTEPSARSLEESFDVDIKEMRRDQCDDYFRKLLKPLLSTKTDADGKFSFVLPKQGRFVLAAKSSRLVGTEVEHYYWLVKVTINGESTKTIMLSNDNNLLKSDSSESALEIICH